MERLFECVAAQPAARLFLGQITGGGASWMSMDPVRRILIHPDGHDTFKTIHGRPTARNRPTHTRRPSGGRGAAFSPLYRQIKELLVQSLDRGEWKPGELIPSEIDLAARFQVSQGTVRKAVDELAAEHLLLRRQGKGTFVATHHEARVRYRFLRLAADDEAQAGSGRAESRILECRRLRAPAEIARGLELRAGEAVIMIRRLLCMDDPHRGGRHLAARREFPRPDAGAAHRQQGPDVRPVRIRVRRQHGARRREAARRGGAGRNRPLLNVSPARRCCRWTECPIPMVTAPWKSGGVCT